MTEKEQDTNALACILGGALLINFCFELLGVYYGV